MKRARMATAWPTVKFAVVVTPARLVTPSSPGVPVKVCTTNVMPWLNPKSPGRALMVYAGEDAIAAPALKRDQRKKTVLAVAEAKVVLLAAVKAVTWTETVWPRFKPLVLVALVKVP